MIVKIQRPIESTDPEAPVFIYDKSRQFQKTRPYTRAWRIVFDTHGLPEWGNNKLFADIHEEGESIVVDRFFEKDLGW